MRVLCTVIFLIVAAERSGVAAQESSRDNPYFPLKVPSRWTYRADDQRVVLRLARVEKVGDTPCAVLETKRPDGLAITEHVAVKADGVYRFRAMALPLEPPLCFFKFSPAKATWAVEAKLGAEKIKGQCTSAQAEVEVPAGKYQTIRVTSALELGEHKFTIVSYFAREVGMVKQEQDLLGKRITLELEKYEVEK